MRKKIAIIGTVGIPACYGGFETLVENLVGNNRNVEYVIFCSTKHYKNRPPKYKNVQLRYIPLNANGFQSVFYDIWSLIKATFCCDEILVLGVSGCCFLPIYRWFSKKKLIINIDGLEHKRNKWNRYVRMFLRFSEKMAVKFADVVVTDNKGIQDYVKQQYDVDSELISYGGDHVLCSVSDNIKSEILDYYKLNECRYSFSVCRIEPENNVDMILEAFAISGQELVFVGNWDRSEYGRILRNKYSSISNIHILNSIYDITTLYVLRSNCAFYIHGHSAGGTNPSLVEAMFFGKPIIAFGVIYNKETTEGKANYFLSINDLVNILKCPYSDFFVNANNMYEIANRCYKWEHIAYLYEKLY